ncbi:MAG: glycine cleavage system protein GcvH [Elusimicrobia bacterium]|nr:glycine cleavage system protein GcvH [Candidatus Obscuribacterium magneticum]
MFNPDDCRFTKTHEWIARDGTVGLTDHAQKEITDVVYVDLPKVSRFVKAGEACTVVESVKAAFDIYSPVSGKIAKVNTTLSKTPALVNQSPYGDGWLFQISIASAKELDLLMSHTDYLRSLESNDH